MCGIYLTNIPFSEDQVNEKLDKIKYRGPDFTGILKKDSLTFGHLRLAILDLDARSNQPYVYKNLTIVFNGEIYNFLDIKNELIKIGFEFETTSDTEVLLIGYYHWGKAILDKLNGMFAFAIYDSITNKVFCARDRMGVKPFYYFWKDGQFEICSQLQPLKNKTSKISEEAISIYLCTGYVPSPYSIFENIYKLQPGHSIEFDLNAKKQIIEQYWNLKPVELTNLTYDEAKNQLKDLLFDAVKIRMQSDVSLGSFLSGGIDSALVTAIASSISNEKIKTFTIGFDDSKYDESKVAEKFSDIIGTEHTTTIVQTNDFYELLNKMLEVYDEPFADSSALPSLLLNKITKNYVTVALSGDGGDESFIGYNHFFSISKFNKLKKIPYVFRIGLSQLLPETNNLKSVLKCKSENDFIERTFIGNQELLNKKSKYWLEKYYSDYRGFSDSNIQKTADLNIKLWLENDSNVKVDRASMANSVETRSPFLDFRVVEFARTLPIDFRFKNGTTKFILKDILKDFIPEQIFNLPKRGFAIPIADWLRNELKENLLVNLTDDILKSIPNLNNKIFKEQLHLHLESKVDYSFNIWRVYILVLWLNKNNVNEDDLS
ncbi:asparagine synthase (glutamine-hydrolyzing) [Paenimyroides tangerinum]|uniref:asparagine synthase (glutamine-hydrolyzing) n=1 Tax=Paenimyroides tangerinum TaxID=2488728 RepID=A0A3P3W7H2_9FLAO|nr:asparagine synthase (glutamine-hydrolyzing) [Paenimyroides tangerinum]RRJ89559.1 asparagine synthase (glutamine-hydrolyzing) [Paenimyroides tangerinum]